MSILLPESIVYKRVCENHDGEIVQRGFWNYASVLMCFFTVTFIQFVCFFLLTISRNFLHFRRKYKNFISMEEKLMMEIIIHVKKIMFDTVIFAFCKFFLYKNLY